MGIINITPDSFYDGGKHNTIDTALSAAEKHLNEGAHFIDVGGYSSRPGADNIDEKTELGRVIPVIEALNKQFPESLISIDTFRGQVAKESLAAGACMINDISAFNLDKKMLEIIKEQQVPYVLMHMKGSPKTMQQNTSYENIVKELLFYFSEKLRTLKAHGVNDVLIDPGFGFGKSTEQNYKLLGALNEFKLHRCPIIVGISRKSMIYKALKTSSLNSINGTTALHMKALQNGANILRVHDVKEAAECIKLHQLTNA